MPPTTKTDGSTYRKDVNFIAKDDDDEQVAAGIVMVPHKVDLQGDWERPETIAQFAEQFGNFEEVDEAGGGVMHAVFPVDHATLERNEIAAADTSVGGEDVPEGAWVQEWRFEDEDLWELVDDGILEGYSIGAVDVRWDGPMEQDDLPGEVAVPDDVPDDELVWELTDGIVREVSAVDIPAVPDAQILETKADADKRLGDHLGNRDGFIDEAVQRGHSEADAERLWEYLNRAADIEGAGDPGSQSMFARAGKAFLSALSGDGSDDGATSEARDRGAAKEDGVPDCWVCGDDAEYQNGDPPGEYLCEEHADPQGDRVEELADKEGRTLSTANRDAVMASIDAGLDVLQDAGVDDLPKRFTDREDTDFDLSEHDAREWTGDQNDEDEDANPFAVDDAADTDDGGDDDTTTDMSNDDTSDDSTDDPMDDAPAWAKSLAEQVNEQAERIDDLADAGKDADADGGDGDTDADDPMADAPEWAKALKSDVDEQAERIDTISQQSGLSDQVDAAGTTADEPEDGLGELGKLLS